MRKNLKKLLSVCIISAAALSAMNLNALAAGFSWPTYYDMTQESFSFDNMANRCTEEEHPNVGYFPDPEDSSNTVVGIRKCPVKGSYADMRAVMNYTESAVMFETDIYRTRQSGDFEIKLFANTGGASGDYVFLFKMDTSGNVYAGSKAASKYTPGNWYRLRIKSNKAKTYHEIYFKNKEDDNFTYLGYVDNNALGFSSNVYIHYYMQNKSDSFMYFDNMSWTLLERDLAKKIHYDFDDVKSTTGSFMSLAINSANMQWDSASFAGETVLKATMNETSALEAYNWEDIPDMDKIYVETSMGFDSGSDEKANLPYQFGIRPVFAEADGTKGSDCRNNMTYGIRYAWSRHVILETENSSENVLDKAQGASLSNNVLYKAGYVYDRNNSVFKAYFIAGNGKTFVKDISSTNYVQEKRYLAGIKLYQRARDSYTTGKAYYDYLYIDEADEMRVNSVTPFNNETGVSLNPEIKVDFNYIIDPESMGNITLSDSAGNEIEITAELSYGKSIVIRPVNTLRSSKTYSVEISGVKDLLGNEAEPFKASFMTGSAVKVENISLNGGAALTDGNNSIVCKLSSNDGGNHNVTAVAAVFDKITNELLLGQAVRKSILNDGSYSVTLDFDTSRFSNYNVELYVWSGLGTMKPYTKVKTFEK